jgi:resolvase-like protein/recombinase
VPRTAVLYLPAGAPADSPDVPAALTIVATVRDEPPLPRGGLTHALDLLAAGAATTLLVPELRALAASLPELAGLLDWLEAAGATLVALDIGLDTATGAAGPALALVREAATWDRRPDRGGPARGRPGMRASSPEVAERIAELRAAGLTLQAIAEALEADGVPTPRGGAHWRPSSVQAALGYRRPRPHPPGAPPLPPLPGPPPPPGPGHGRPPGPPPPHHRRP